MNTKKICVIANGYSEEMMATKLMCSIREKLIQTNQLKNYQLLGGSLVSSGKWFHEEKFPTFFSGGMTPSGGFPTRSIKGFFADLKAGAFSTPIIFKNMITEWKKHNLEAIVVVGDFLLMMLAVPALKNKNVPLIFIPTAKSDYIQPHYKIEKYFIKKYATIVFPRDQKTANDFIEYGINAVYEGNIMQDLLDVKSPELSVSESVIALLPGSRDEAYGNLFKILKVVSEVNSSIHWAFVQASSLDNEKIKEVFEVSGWQYKTTKEGVSSWSKDKSTVFCYPNTQFNSVALSCVCAISLAGTGSEQITGLGKPVIGFVGTGPQSTQRRMDDNQKLLGDAFIYEKSYPQGVVQKVYELIKNQNERTRRGQVGLEMMGAPGGTDKIAQYITNEILNK